MELLDAVEVRVLGALMEKEATTPEYYPLSLNALVNACNQKTNREPVTSYDEDTVADALASLREKRFAVADIYGALIDYRSVAGRISEVKQRIVLSRGDRALVDQLVIRIVELNICS